MDLGSNVTHLKPSDILMRGAMVFGWMIVFLLSIPWPQTLIGTMLPIAHGTIPGM